MSLSIRVVMLGHVWYLFWFWYFDIPVVFERLGHSNLGVEIMGEYCSKYGKPMVFWLTIICLLPLTHLSGFLLFKYFFYGACQRLCWKKLLSCIRLFKNRTYVWVQFVRDAIHSMGVHSICFHAVSEDDSDTDADFITCSDDVSTVADMPAAAASSTV